MTRTVNAVLDWADRRGGWFPALAGALIGGGISWGLHGAAWAWLLLVAGLVMTAVRPFGTGQRRRRRIAAARALLGMHKRLSDQLAAELSDLDKVIAKVTHDQD